LTVMSIRTLDYFEAQIVHYNAPTPRPGQQAQLPTIWDDPLAFQECWIKHLDQFPRTRFLWDLAASGFVRVLAITTPIKYESLGMVHDVWCHTFRLGALIDRIYCLYLAGGTDPEGKAHLTVLEWLTKLGLSYFAGIGPYEKPPFYEEEIVGLITDLADIELNQSRVELNYRTRRFPYEEALNKPVESITVADTAAVHSKSLKLREIDLIDIAGATNRTRQPDSRNAETAPQMDPFYHLRTLSWNDILEDDIDEDDDPVEESSDTPSEDILVEKAQPEVSLDDSPTLIRSFLGEELEWLFNKSPTAALSYSNSAMEAYSKADNFATKGKILGGAGSVLHQFRLVGKLPPTVHPAYKLLSSLQVPSVLEVPPEIISQENILRNGPEDETPIAVVIEEPGGHKICAIGIGLDEPRPRRSRSSTPPRRQQLLIEAAPRKPKKRITKYSENHILVEIPREKLERPDLHPMGVEIRMDRHASFHNLPLTGKGYFPNIFSGEQQSRPRAVIDRDLRKRKVPIRRSMAEWQRGLKNQLGTERSMRFSRSGNPSRSHRPDAISRLANPSRTSTTGYYPDYSDQDYDENPEILDGW